MHSLLESVHSAEFWKVKPLIMDVCVCVLNHLYLNHVELAETVPSFPLGKQGSCPGAREKKGPTSLYGPDQNFFSWTPTQYQKTSIKFRFVFTKKD